MAQKTLAQGPSHEAILEARSDRSQERLSSEFMPELTMGSWEPLTRRSLDICGERVKGFRLRTASWGLRTKGAIQGAYDKRKNELNH